MSNKIARIEKKSALQNKSIERKTVPFNVIDVKLDENNEFFTFYGYGSVFDFKDYGDDVVVKGAFTKTLQESADEVRVLDQHNMTEPVGRPSKMYEDENGLYLEAVVPYTTKGRDLFLDIKYGVKNGLSIGYQIVKDQIGKMGNQTVRFLKELRLIEISVVTFPMNKLATITGIKQLDFNQALANEDLQSRFWDYKMIFSDVMREIMESETMSASEKQAAMLQSLSQFNTAMTTWINQVFQSGMLGSKEFTEEFVKKFNRPEAETLQRREPGILPTPDSDEADEGEGVEIAEKSKKLAELIELQAKVSQFSKILRKEK